MYKNLNSKSFVSRCKCVSWFDTILVVNLEEWFSHDAAQNSWVLVFRSALLLFSIHCLDDVYVLKRQNKDYLNLKSHFLSKPSVNNYMRGSNGVTAGPDSRPTILNSATLSEPPWSATRQPLPS